MLVSSSAHVSKLTQCFQEAETVIILFAPKNFRGFKTWGQMTTVPEAGCVLKHTLSWAARRCIATCSPRGTRD